MCYIVKTIIEAYFDGCGGRSGENLDYTDQLEGDRF